MTIQKITASVGISNAINGLQATRIFLSHASPWALIVLLGVAISVRIFISNFNYLDVIAVGIIVFLWPFYEWAIHRYILHAKPYVGSGVEKSTAVASAHRAHHANPSDLRWMFIPMHVYPIAVPPLAWLFWLLTPSASMAVTLLCAELALSLHYEWTHFLAHTGWRPRSRYYQARIRKHLLHHFRDETKWWGVTTGLADYFLGTDPDPRLIKKSSTTTSLGR